MDGIKKIKSYTNEINKKNTKPFFINNIVFAIATALLLFGITGCVPATDTVTDIDTVMTEATTATPAPVNDFADVSTEFTITNGYYTTGIDLPVGKCTIEVVSGKGNVSSSAPLYDGLNQIMGVDDRTGFYEQAAEWTNYWSLEDNVVLSIDGGVVIKLNYSMIKSNFTGREYDVSDSFHLSEGNYVSGVDFPAGIYNLDFVSGSGTIASSNLLSGGINEIIGTEDGSGFYSQSFDNLELVDHVELSIAGDVMIKLTPQK